MIRRRLADLALIALVLALLFAVYAFAWLSRAARPIRPAVGL